MPVTCGYEGLRVICTWFAPTARGIIGLVRIFDSVLPLTLHWGKQPEIREWRPCRTTARLLTVPGSAGTVCCCCQLEGLSSVCMRLAVDEPFGMITRGLEVYRLLRLL